jgi:hypothetical protein
LEAQRKAVLDYLNGDRWDVLTEFTEVETGKGRDALAKRPQLGAAPALCRKRNQRTKAALAAAKARRVRFGEQGRINAHRHKADAEAFAQQIASMIRALQAEGVKPVRSSWPSQTDAPSPRRRVGDGTCRRCTASSNDYAGRLVPDAFGL